MLGDTQATGDHQDDNGAQNLNQDANDNGVGLGINKEGDEEQHANIQVMSSNIAKFVLFFLNEGLQ